MEVFSLCAWLIFIGKLPMVYQRQAAAYFLVASFFCSVVLSSPAGFS